METTLGGNKWITGSTKLQFKVEETGTQDVGESGDELERSCVADSALCSSLKSANITMKPMQIRTFIVKNSAGALHAGAILAVVAFTLLKMFSI